MILNHLNLNQLTLHYVFSVLTVLTVDTLLSINFLSVMLVLTVDTRMNLITFISNVSVDSLSV